MKDASNKADIKLFLKASVYGLLSPVRNMGKVIPYTTNPKAPGVVYFLIIIKKISPYLTISH